MWHVHRIGYLSYGKGISGFQSFGRHNLHVSMTDWESACTYQSTFGLIRVPVEPSHTSTRPIRACNHCHPAGRIRSYMSCNGLAVLMASLSKRRGVASSITTLRRGALLVVRVMTDRTVLYLPVSDTSNKAFSSE